MEQLLDWKGSIVVINAATLDQRGNKTNKHFHGELIEVAHKPFDESALFSIDEIVLKTDDMANIQIGIPTESIKEIQCFQTEVIITKMNGFTTTITLNKKKGRGNHANFNL